jgi:hypothetical protein
MPARQPRCPLSHALGIAADPQASACKRSVDLAETTRLAVIAAHTALSGWQPFAAQSPAWGPLRS